MNENRPHTSLVVDRDSESYASPNHLKTINDFALRLMSIGSKEELFWYVAREVVAKLGFQDCVVYDLDQSQGLLLQAAAIGPKNPQGEVIANALRIPVGQGVTGHVAKTGQSCIIKDLRQDARYIPDLEPALSEICVALAIDGVTVGVIDCEDPRADHFGPAHLEVLNTVAAMTSAKLKLLLEAGALEEQNRSYGELIEDLKAEVGARKQAETALAALEKRLTDIASNIPGMVYQTLVDADGRLTFSYVSPTVRDIAGLSASDIIANPDVWFRLIHPADRAEREVAVRRASDGPRPYRWEGRMRRADGGVWWSRVSSVPTPQEDGSTLWNGLVLDVTEQREAEEAVRTRNTWLRAILENAPVEIVLKNRDGKIMAISKNVADEFGSDTQDFVGYVTSDIIPLPVAQVYMAADRKVVETGEPIQQSVVEEWEGYTRHLLNQKFPLRNGGGEIIGVCSITSDLSQLKEAEEKLHHAQKLEAVGQLTGGIAHDVNNLLAVIQGNADLMLDDSGESGVYLESIIQATTRGAELTQRLLAFSRQQPLQPKILSLADLVHMMTPLLNRTLGPSISIKTTSSAELWQAIADPGQVENVILNLALNARDAMPDGGDLSISCANIRLESEDRDLDEGMEPGDYVVLQVRDSGCGMPPEVSARAFEPFFTTKQVGQGSGLGLSTVYGFAKQSGGRTVIESMPGEGTSVRVYLPRAEGVPEIQRQPEGSEQPAAKGETILLVEDDPNVRTMVRKLLLGLSYSVLTADGVDKALKILGETERVDLVLTDILLKDSRSGLELAADIDRDFPATKVILMSGYPADDSRLRPDQILLPKPFQRSQLARILRQALTRQ